MQTQAYFEDIQLHILHELRKANSSIHIAVAWFTDPDIFEQLCQKAEAGTRVELIVINDSINRKSGIQYERLRELGGVSMMVGDKKKSSSIMHNKFCVIDGETIITGSYNWSRRAQKNSENITVISDHPELGRQFIDEFESIFEHHSGKGVKGADLGKIIARLKTLQHVVYLDDEDDINLQLAKLKKLISGCTGFDEVKKIVKLIENDSYELVDISINAFVNAHRTINIYTDPEIPELTFELKALELQVSALEDEKAELEKLLHSYNFRHAVEVGEIIRRILLLRKEKLKVEAKQDASKEDAYNEAQQDYDDYDHNYQEASKREILTITKAEKRELKAIFRACSKMCHPDVVAPEFKAQASQLFTRLTEANEKNKIEVVNSIYDQLKKGIFTPMSATVSDAQKLHNQVVMMRGKIKDLAIVIYSIRTTEAYQRVTAIEDFDEYFSGLKHQLQEELDSLEAETA